MRGLWLFGEKFMSEVKNEHNCDYNPELVAGREAARKRWNARRQAALDAYVYPEARYRIKKHENNLWYCEELSIRVRKHVLSPEGEYINPKYYKNEKIYSLAQNGYSHYEEKLNSINEYDSDVNFEIEEYWKELQEFSFYVEGEKWLQLYLKPQDYEVYFSSDGKRIWQND